MRYKHAVRQTRRARVLAKPQPRSPSTPCMDAVHINWNRPPSSLYAKCPIFALPWGPRSAPAPNNRNACRIVPCVPSQAWRLRMFAMWFTRLVSAKSWRLPTTTPAHATTLVKFQVLKTRNNRIDFGPSKPRIWILFKIVPFIRVRYLQCNERQDLGLLPRR